MDNSKYIKWLYSRNPNQLLRYFTNLSSNPEITKKKWGDIDLVDDGNSPIERELRDYMRHLAKPKDKHKYTIIKMNKFLLEGCQNEYRNDMLTQKMNEIYEDEWKGLNNEQIKNTLELTQEDIYLYTDEMTVEEVNNFRLKKNYNGFLNYMFKFMLKAIDTKVKDRLSEFSLTVKEEYEKIIIMPKGSLFYTGRSGLTKDKRKILNYNSDRFRWFAKDKHTALLYALQGIMSGEENVLYDSNKKKIILKDDYKAYVYRFKAAKNLKLLNINGNNLTQIKFKYSYMVEIIDSIFPMKDLSVVYRESILPYDQLFSLFLCKVLKVDGYYYGQKDEFLPEIMICNISDSMKNADVFVWQGKIVLEWMKHSGAKNYGEKVIFFDFYLTFASGF